MKYFPANRPATETANRNGKQKRQTETANRNGKQKRQTETANRNGFRQAKILDKQKRQSLPCRSQFLHQSGGATREFNGARFLRPVNGASLRDGHSRGRGDAIRLLR